MTSALIGLTICLTLSFNSVSFATTCHACYCDISEEESPDSENVAQRRSYVSCSEGHNVEKECAGNYIDNINVASMDAGQDMLQNGLPCTCVNDCKGKFAVGDIKEMMFDTPQWNNLYKRLHGNARPSEGVSTTTSSTSTKTATTGNDRASPLQIKERAIQDVKNRIMEAFNLDCPVCVKKGLPSVLAPVEGCNSAKCEGCKTDFCFLCLKEHQDGGASHAHVRTHSGDFWENRDGHTGEAPLAGKYQEVDEYFVTENHPQFGKQRNKVTKPYKYSDRYHWLLFRDKLEPLFNETDPNLKNEIIESLKGFHTVVTVAEGAQRGQKLAQNTSGSKESRIAVKKPFPLREIILARKGKIIIASWKRGNATVEKEFIAKDHPQLESLFSHGVRELKDEATINRLTYLCDFSPLEAFLRKQKMWPLPVGKDGAQWIDEVMRDQLLDHRNRVALLQNERIYLIQAAEKASSEVVRKQLQDRSRQIRIQLTLLKAEIFNSLDVGTKLEKGGQQRHRRHMRENIYVVPVLVGHPNAAINALAMNLQRDVPDFFALGGNFGRLYRIIDPTAKVPAFLITEDMPEKATHEMALKQCVDIGGRSPSREQLEALGRAIRKAGHGVFDKDMIPGMARSLVWSLTLRQGNSGYAHVFDGNSGAVTYDGRGSKNTVRCVRPAPLALP